MPGAVIQLNTIIALFRGINVGGKSRVPMRGLVALFEELGLKNIRTYIQSGNVIFDTHEKPGKELTQRISEKVRDRFGFSPHILLLTVEELNQAMDRNPFPQAVAIPQSLHLGFLSSSPMNPDLSRLEKLKSASEHFQVIGKVFYLFAPEGVSRSKLAAGAEPALGFPMTDRNWRTVCKIAELAKTENSS